MIASLVVGFIYYSIKARIREFQEERAIDKMIKEAYDG